MLRKTILYLFLGSSVNALADNIVPIGNDNNVLYYKIGGGHSFSLPPVAGTDTIHLDTNTNLGLGYSCSAFNPALSISNTLNDLKSSAENLSRDIVSNATGSLIMMPMYELAKSNPTLYALLNNQLLSADHQLEVSTKSCAVVKEQINRGENPYQDWGKIAVNDQWKTQLSFAARGEADINQAKKTIDAHSGDEGVAWVNGSKESNGSLHAGGKNQPPVYVIADTVKAGYNAMQNRTLQSDNASSGELTAYFAWPRMAVDWITHVVGDQIITTCNDEACQKKQGSLVGHGLLPQLVACGQDKDNCVATIRAHLGLLVTGNEAESYANLARISAGGIVISPEAIHSIRLMEPLQQAIIINKLAQEVAVQRVIDKALVARQILTTGAQVPVIAANHPAEVILQRAIENLDKDIRSLVFESQIRKQMMSDTLSQVLAYSNQQQHTQLQLAPIVGRQSLMEKGARQETRP
jgi:integrating conjugative element protein (TIGR03755 family)